MSFWKWSRTAANNATADASINWAEGQAPSTVNDSARAMMAAASKYRDDVAGAIATAGSASAYTLASFQVFDTLAHMDGAMIAFTAHAGNAGACTLNVDGLGAKPLRSAPSTELLAGMLVAGTPYAATYYNVSGEWILRGLTGAPGIPLGVALPYFGVTAPASAFALPFGQAISRLTYVNLFNLIATAYGAVVLYLWKVIVWDIVLNLGTTDPIGGDVAEWAGWIVTAYVGGRSLEKIARTIWRRP